MNFRKKSMGVLAAALLASVGQASAELVSIGTADGFGMGVGIEAQSGVGFDSFFIPEGVSGDTTDVLFTETVTLNFGYVLPAAVQSATLRLFTGGWGLYGQASVAVNGVQVGLLTDGDQGNDLLPYAGQTAHLDTFLLNLALVTLTGNDEVTISIVQGPDPLGLLDLGAIDFAQLDIAPADTGGDVPEPGSLALVAAGLFAARAARRSQRR